MERKLPRKVFRFFLLFSLKEAYLTCRNFLGLFYHPFKTIKVIEREKDPLQFLVIFGLPFYFWVGGIAGIIVGRFLIGAPFLSFGPLAITSFLLISFITGVIISYLAYWVFVYFKKRHV